MQDIYRLRKIVKQEEADARPMSSDGDQPTSNYEHSEDSPIEEDEKPTIKLEDVSEVGSTTEVDEDLDEQSDEYSDPGIITSPSPGSAIPHLYTAGAAASTEFAASPVVPAVSMESTVSPVVPAAGMESTAALPVVPATQAAHYIAPPPVPPPHNVAGSWFMPPPVIVHIPYPPYHMTLYPLCPVYVPPPTH